MLEHCCDPLIRGKDASGMRGGEKRFSVWTSLLIAGKHGGECSMEGDGLRAEGEFLDFIWTFAFGKCYGRGLITDSWLF